MATQTAIFPFGSRNGVTATLNGSTATSAIIVGSYVLVAVNASDDVTITLGSATTAPTTPSATVGFRIPANQTVTIDLGRNYDRFMIFNTGSGGITYSYQVLARS